MSLPDVERWPNSLLPGNARNTPTAYTFLPIAMETLGSMNDSAYHFFEDLGRKISEVSGDSRDRSLIFQVIANCVQNR